MRHASREVITRDAQRLQPQRGARGHVPRLLGRGLRRLPHQGDWQPVPSHGLDEVCPPPLPPSRTKWTRLVHPSVLTGHVGDTSACPACPPFGAARAAGAQQARFAKLHLSPGWPQPRSSRRAAACAAGPLSARRSRFSTRLNSSRAILSPRPRCPPPPPSAHPARVVSLDQTRAHLPWGVPVAGSDGALPGLTITAADAHPLRRQDASRFTSSFKAQITEGVGSLPPPPAHLQAAHGAAVPGSRASVRRSSQWTI